VVIKQSVVIFHLQYKHIFVRVIALPTMQNAAPSRIRLQYR
jgi:hypothetical protein